MRLELSINSGIKSFGDDKPIVVCMHFPPTNNELLERSEFLQIMKKYGVKTCVYGHLHSEALTKDVVEGEVLRN